jgi:diadenosine tetraphosphate (Ap4A) HIT family hydrolase
MQTDDCFLCRKHRGQEAAPPGGYVFEDANWMVCHAPVKRGPLGTLFIEARRHVLDFGDFNEAEARTFGILAKRVYAVLRRQVGPQRTYQISMMEGVSHFHTWIVPRASEVPERGVAFLARTLTCTEEAASALAAELRAALHSP